MLEEERLLWIIRFVAVALEEEKKPPRALDDVASLRGAANEPTEPTVGIECACMARKEHTRQAGECEGMCVVQIGYCWC